MSPKFGIRRVGGKTGKRWPHVNLVGAAGPVNASVGGPIPFPGAASNSLQLMLRRPDLVAQRADVSSRPHANRSFAARNASIKARLAWINK